jgi:general secretion pathway protein A
VLVQALLRQVGEKCSPQAKIVYPQLPADQLLATIVDQLSGSRSTNTPSTRDSLARLEALLADNMAADRHAVIVVDEAHLLRDTESLQTLRLLLNFEVDGRTPLTLILVGQAGLLTTLERLPDFDQRIASRCVLRRFEPAETAAYVEHRLRLAGSEQTIFDNDALSALHRHSQGIPRKVNRLADLTLLVGFAEERRVLQAEHVEAVAEELTMPAAA